MAKNYFELFLAFLLIFSEFGKKIYFYMGYEQNISQAYVLVAFFGFLILFPSRLRKSKDFFVFLLLFVAHIILAKLIAPGYSDFEWTRALLWVSFIFLVSSIKSFNLDVFLDYYVRFFFSFVVASILLAAFFGLDFLVVDNRFSFFSSEPSHFAYFVIVAIFSLIRIRGSLKQFSVVMVLCLLAFSSVSMLALLYYLISVLYIRRENFRTSNKVLLVAFFVSLLSIVFVFLGGESQLNNLAFKVLDDASKSDLNASLFAFDSNATVAINSLRDISFVGLGPSDFKLAYDSILQGSVFAYSPYYGINSSTGSTLFFNGLLTFGCAFFIYFAILFFRALKFPVDIRLFLLFYFSSRIFKLAAPWEAGGLLPFVLLFSYYHSFLSMVTCPSVRSTFPRRF